LFCAWRLLGPTSYWIGNNNPNKFFFFFAGMRRTKYARTYDLWVILAHFVIGLMIGFLVTSPLAQIIVIVAVITIITFICIILWPWRSVWLNIADILTWVCILVCVVIWLVYAIIDQGPCIGCGNREGVICWVIVLFFWLGLMIGLILFLFALFRVCYGKQIETEYIQQDFYHL
jgi:hypothetical protein